MKIVVPKNILNEAVSHLSSVVSAKSTMPILGHILMEASKKEKTLTLMATDLEVGVTAILPCECEKEGVLAVPAKKFADVIRELPDKDVSLTADEKRHMKIVCDRSRFSINGLPKDDFPALPVTNKELVFPLPQKTLREMISRTIYAVSTDETRYFLNGCYVIAQENLIRMIATDGHRLAYTQSTLKGSFKKGTSVIIPTKALQELMRNLDDEGEIEVALAENQVFFEMPGLRIVSRLIVEQFPNYEQVIPKEHTRRVVVNTQLLNDALRRVSLFSNQKSNSVRFHVSKDGIELSANTPELGEAAEEVPAVLEGEDLDIAFNARYVMDVLRAIDAEQISIDLANNLSPGLVKAVGNEDSLAVIMPMRL